MRLDVFHALLSGPGQHLLAQAEQEYDGLDALVLGSRLRRRYDPDLVAAALTQIELRRRAAPKFGSATAARLYLTSAALEQATTRSVADHRAARLQTHGVDRLVDVGCGIGADLLAAARAGIAVTGVERDPVRAAMARANLAALGLPGQVLEGEADEADLAGYDAVFVDPARRDARGRVFDPAAYSPPWTFVERVLSAYPACVKISPAIPHRMVPDGVEAEWVSDVGEVKEAALWSGPLASAARRATLLPGGDTLTEADERPRRLGPVGELLWEPDGAVIRAGVLTAVAETLGAWLVDEHIAYLSGPPTAPTPFARGYRVVDTLPVKEKPLRAALRRRGVGTLTVKKRGVQVSPEVLRRRLALRGSATATIVLTRVAGKAVTLLVEPLRPR